MTLYPEQSLYQEMAFIAYYFHWSKEEVMKLDHRSRRRWCLEISDIHRKVNPSKEKRDETPLSQMRPSIFPQGMR